jgi:hypothetical protein
MRSYPHDSPQAAARVVALSVLAGGHLCSSELKALERAGISERLGLYPGEFQHIIQGLCEDLMSTSHLNWGDLCQPQSGTMTQLLSELNDRRLREEVISLCIAAAQADHHISEHEFAVLVVFAATWKLPLSWDLTCMTCTTCEGREAQGKPH